MVLRSDAMGAEFLVETRYDGTARAGGYSFNEAEKTASGSRNVVGLGDGAQQSVRDVACVI